MILMKLFGSSAGFKQLRSGLFFQNSTDRQWCSAQISSNYPGDVFVNIGLLREGMAAVIENNGMGQKSQC